MRDSRRWMVESSRASRASPHGWKTTGPYGLMISRCAADHTYTMQLPCIMHVTMYRSCHACPDAEQCLHHIPQRQALLRDGHTACMSGRMCLCHMPHGHDGCMCMSPFDLFARNEQVMQCFRPPACAWHLAGRDKMPPSPVFDCVLPAAAPGIQ